MNDIKVTIRRSMPGDYSVDVTDGEKLLTANSLFLKPGETYTLSFRSDARDADQVEGPSLADVVELCEEFGFVPGSNGALLWGDTFREPPQDPLPVLQEMVAAAITRWRAPAAQPAAQPVDVANLKRLPEGVDPFAPGDPDADNIQRLAQILVEVDGRYDTYLEDAQAILAHPGFSGCHDGPVASPAQGVLDDRYEFSVIDSEDCEQAGGSALTLNDAIREGRNYLRQCNQDGPHRLELRRVLVLDCSEPANA